MHNLIFWSLVAIAETTVIVWLVWKNKKDEKLLNPDAQDAVEEAMMDADRRKDRNQPLTHIKSSSVQLHQTIRRLCKPQALGKKS